MKHMENLIILYEQQQHPAMAYVLWLKHAFPRAWRFLDGLSSVAIEKGIFVFSVADVQCGIK